MANQKQGNKHNKQHHHTNPWTYSIKIGFFAGIIWGAVRWLFYQMKFTTELPGFTANLFFQEAFLKKGWGVWVGVGSFVLFSIAAALLYMIALGRLRGPWPGVGYGFVWWVFIFIGIGPFIGMTESVTKAGWNTLFTELCVFILWGIFIGYSIAFEFTDEASREPIRAQ